MPLISIRGSSHGFETCDAPASSLGAAQPTTWVSTLNARIASRPLSREQEIREAVVLTLCDPAFSRGLQLLRISRREWQRLLRWLAISGLALYFLDRMMELQLCDMLPPVILAHLLQNLRDNTERTRGMIAESLAIQKEFQQSRLSYAVLKGFSFCPSSVPTPELRLQFDLDFLIAETSAPEARAILERKGYRLYAISGRSWEFKINATPGISLVDMYKDLPGRSVELHFEADIPGRAPLLGRIEKREFHGISMPVLSPVDLFLGQGLHAYRHILSEFSRTAHLLEFRRHVLLRCDDGKFWDQLRSQAEGDERASLGLGVITLLITSVTGDFAPEALRNWTVDRLPRPARLWVEVYGSRAVFGSFPGSKLYLLLQSELESAGVPAQRSLRQTLLPSRLPPAFVLPSADETLPVRIRRYRMQLNTIISRLRFHIVEGIRYARESYRWRQHMNGLAR